MERRPAMMPIRIARIRTDMETSAWRLQPVRELED
jgi:hypothetical protein